MTRGGKPFQERTSSAVVNYGLAHGVRFAAAHSLVPLLNGFWAIDGQLDSMRDESAGSDDKLFWEQSGRRHHPSYYKRLLQSQACLAFGGYFAPDFSRHLDSFALRCSFAIAQLLGLRTSAVVQFDSWRFWESLAAGCLTLHVDLDKYGCLLPVQPVNWKHYVGIDFQNLADDIRHLKDSKSRLQDIAEAGREWAVRHYSPRPTAERFLELLESKQ
jgi:hypothetical protein